MTTLSQYRTALDLKLAESTILVRKCEDAAQAHTTARQTLLDTEAARVVIQEVSEALQQEAHAAIANVVSLCLSAIFDNPYRFSVRFDKKRGKTEAVLLFERDGLVLDDPLYQAGGGATDVAGFALRLACLVLRRPPLRRLLVLDEPFKNIRGREYKKRVRALLERLAEDFGVQFIICADIEAYPELALGHIVEVV